MASGRGCDVEGALNLPSHLRLRLSKSRHRPRWLTFLRAHWPWRCKETQRNAMKAERKPNVHMSSSGVSKLIQHVCPLRLFLLVLSFRVKAEADVTSHADMPACLNLITYLLLWTDPLRRASVDTDEHHPAVTLSLCSVLAQSLPTLLFAALFSFVWAFWGFIFLLLRRMHALLHETSCKPASLFVSLRCCRGQRTSAFHWFINDGSININRKIQGLVSL